MKTRELKLNTLVTIENPFQLDNLDACLMKTKQIVMTLRIADFLRIHVLPSPIKEEKYMALRLTRTRYQLIKQLTRKKQHFLENPTYKSCTLVREVKTNLLVLFVLQ